MGFDPRLLEARGTAVKSIPPVAIVLVPLSAEPYHAKPLQMQLTEDMRHILEDELRHNLFFDGPAASRSHTLEVRYKYTVSINPLWVVPSVFTLTLINVFGFPYGSTSVEVTLQASLRDAQDRVHRLYSAAATAKVYTAYYWGTAQWSGPRVAHARAAHEAIESLKNQIVEDTAAFRTVVEPHSNPHREGEPVGGREVNTARNCPSG